MLELERESQLGMAGLETNEQPIPVIDLANLDVRRAEIAAQLLDAAVHVGFFQVANHGVPPGKVREAFAMAERFFALPEATKAQWPLCRNAGWESLAQVRPSTGVPDQKESYQITRPRMAGLYPAEEQLPGFRATMLDFEALNWSLGMRILSCLAEGIGFDRDFFTRVHDPAGDTYQCTLRLLHYYAIAPELLEKLEVVRGGAHTDFNCLTLLYQRTGQPGLQVCPGRAFDAPRWTPVDPREDLVTCNIGDMLMRWSDNQLLSTFHRVRKPLAGEYLGPRYSMAFFCQANTDALITSLSGKYPAMTAGDYLAERMRANYQNTR